MQKGVRRMDEKRKMQEILHYSLSGLKENPFLSQRVIEQAKGEKHVKKKISFSVIIIIAVLLIGTMTALAAGVEDVNAFLYKLWPDAARALRPLNLSDEQAGIRLDVISATLNDNHLLITYSLTDLEENRINIETTCQAVPNVPFVSNGHGSYSLLDSEETYPCFYDFKKHQLVFASYYHFDVSQNAAIDNSKSIIFTVDGLENVQDTVLDLWPLMAGQDYTVKAIHAPTKGIGINFITNKAIAESAGAPVITSSELPDILNPENNLHIPLIDGIELSGIGWIDGNLHVQIHETDRYETGGNDYTSYPLNRTDSYINLLDQQGNPLMHASTQLPADVPYFIWEMYWNDGKDRWYESIFPVKPDEMEQYIICGTFSNLRKDVEDLMKCKWSVTFPANMILVEEDSSI